MPKRNLIWIAVAITVALLVVWLRDDTPVTGTPENIAADLKALIRIHKLAEEHALGGAPADAKEAIRAYTKQIGPYCRYISPEREAFFRRLLGGRRCDPGLHYAIDPQTRQVRVLAPVVIEEGTEPVVEAGDILLAIDGQVLIEPTLEDVAKRLDGKDGSAVSLTIQHPGGAKKAVLLVRKAYRVESLAGVYRNHEGQWEYMIDPESPLAYVRINEFVRRNGGIAGTGTQFSDLMGRLASRGAGGLVLDLRDNPGGSLVEAVEVVDRFLADGLIVRTQERDGNEERHMAHEQHTFPDIPVVILVNGGTASAPEIVAGAMKQHRRAVLVGAATRGKNVILSLYSVGPGLGQVLLPTARFSFTEADEPAPEGKDPAAGIGIDGQPAPVGIGPHLPEQIDPAALMELALLRCRMAQAAEAPSPGSGDSLPAVQPTQPDVQTLIALDKPLATALLLLKSPAMYKATLQGRPR